MEEKNVNHVERNIESRPHWSESTLIDRHSSPPSPDDIEGPYWSEYNGYDGEFEYLELHLGSGEYTIEITNTADIWPGDENPRIIERVLFHDGRLVLEAHNGDDEKYRLTEDGLTHYGNIQYGIEPRESRIENPDVVLWERSG